MPVVEGLVSFNCKISRPIAGQTYCVVGFNERIVDSDNLNVIVLDSIAEDDTANTTETVNTDLDWCHDAIQDVRAEQTDVSEDRGVDSSGSLINSFEKRCRGEKSRRMDSGWDDILTRMIFLWFEV